MSMKNKIRRAFEQAQPNVLDRVLKNCPESNSAVPIRKKKRLSDRAVEWIATAASLALLIGAVTAGVLYFRSVYGDNLSDSSSGDTLQASQPPKSTAATEAPSNVTLSTSPEEPANTTPSIEPGAVTVSELNARDIALSMRGHDIEHVRCLKISNNQSVYEVYYELGEYAYNFHISMADGSVIYDAGAVTVGFNYDELMTHLLGWSNAQGIALGDCGRGVAEIIGFTYMYTPGDPDYYHMELYFPDGSFTYRIGALEGEILEGPNVEPVPPDGAIGIEMAIEIALNHTGHMDAYLAGNVDDFATKYDEYGPPSTYYVYFRVGGQSYEVGIHAYTGEVLLYNCFIDDPSDITFYTKEDAIRMALAYSNIPQDRYPVIECHQVGTEINRTIYLVICKKPGMTLTTMVDANSLRVMDHGVREFPEGTISGNSAIGVLLDHLALDDSKSGMTAMKGTFNDGSPFYCIKLPIDNLLHIAVVDAYTGEMLIYTTAEMTPVPSESMTQDQAIEFALANVFLSLKDTTELTCVYNQLNSTYTVSFLHQSDEPTRYTVILDAVNGSVVDLYSTVGE